MMTPGRRRFFRDRRFATDRDLFLFSLSPASDPRVHVPQFVSRAESIRSHTAHGIGVEHKAGTFGVVRAGTFARRAAWALARAAPA